jgi:hypothetical protein
MVRSTKAWSRFARLLHWGPRGWRQIQGCAAAVEGGWVSSELGGTLSSYLGDGPPADPLTDSQCSLQALAHPMWAD